MSSSGKSMYPLNFDVSYNNLANKFGAGCVIRDNLGELVIAASYNLTKIYPEYCNNVAIADAIALLNGLKLAKFNNIELNLIKGDNKEVIDSVLNRGRRPSKGPLSEIIQQIVEMIDPVTHTIVLIDREANQVGELIKQEMSCSSNEVVGEGEESSLTVKNAGMAGAAVAGLGMLAWGVLKLMFGKSLFNQQEHKNKAKSSWGYVVDVTRNSLIALEIMLRDNVRRQDI
uniref:RNase H type-1 domain-containing protein n=1 Tax=Chenopodium quinoa TaxID=63459 RepID=A0A803KVK8_CHEQI